MALNEALVGSSGRVHAALLDSINLVGAMEALFELVRTANRYMDEREAQFAASPAGEALLLSGLRKLICTPAASDMRMVMHKSLMETVCVSQRCSLNQV